MSVDADQVVIGEVINGTQVHVAFPFYAGSAGCMPAADGAVSVAYQGNAPDRLSVGIVDGVRHRVLSWTRSSTTANMVVLIASPIDG